MSSLFRRNIGGKGMSRIGRMPIAVPAGVTVDIAENNKVTVKGPKGELLKEFYQRLWTLK